VGIALRGKTTRKTLVWPHQRPKAASWEKGVPMTPTTEKTLLEHHYEARIGVLRDEPGNLYAKRMKTVEGMARENGWKFMCSVDEIRRVMWLQEIYTA
jgi:hypothetical protein